MSKSPSEKFLNVRIEPAEKEVIDRTFNDMGMKQIEGVSRLMRWFASQDEKTRYAIVGPDSLRPGIARMVLEKMAATEPAEARRDLSPQQEADLNAVVDEELRQRGAAKRSSKKGA